MNGRGGGGRWAALRRNRTHGANALTRSLLNAVGTTLRGLRGDPDPGTTLRETARNVALAQPAMGAFQRWSDQLQQAANARDPARAVRRLREVLRRERGRLAREAPRAARRAADRLPRDARVLTLSRSDAVERTLRCASRRHRLSSVLVLESLPGGEGRASVAALRAVGVNARLLRDAEGARAARRVDAVLLGADGLYEDGSLVHKVHTRSVALAAHRAGVPVYVVAGRSKAAGRRHPPRPLPRLFDITPGYAITAVVTDRGVYRPRSSRRAIPPSRATH